MKVLYRPHLTKVCGLRRVAQNLAEGLETGRASITMPILTNSQFNEHEEGALTLFAQRLVKQESTIVIGRRFSDKNPAHRTTLTVETRGIYDHYTLFGDMVGSAAASGLTRFPMFFMITNRIAKVEWHRCFTNQDQFVTYCDAFTERGARDKSYATVSTITDEEGKIVGQHDRHKIAFGRAMRGGGPTMVLPFRDVPLG